MQRIKKGDEVIVTTGKDKGRRGSVMAILGDRVMVENVNVVKKHAKPNPMAGVEGGIIEKEMSIHISNVMPLTLRPTRVIVLVLKSWKMVRKFASSSLITKL